MKAQITREEWLQKAIAICTKTLFNANGYKVPEVKVSVGFPGGGSARTRIGEHWHPAASDDKLGSIFISPVLEKQDVVLATLVHEMVHAAVGNQAGHGPIFKKCALKVGLTGKMRSTEAGPALVQKFFPKLVKKIGPYPHRKLNLGASPIKKQSTRLVKCECQECGYIARTTNSHLDRVGAPICPCNSETMTVC